jgi:hypothetical protein
VCLLDEGVFGGEVGGAVVGGSEVGGEGGH